MTHVLMHTYMHMCICVVFAMDVWLYGCRTSDEFFQQLEDNQVMLSTIKASRHVKAFEKEVSHFSALPHSTAYMHVMDPHR